MTAERSDRPPMRRPPKDYDGVMMGLIVGGLAGVIIGSIIAYKAWPTVPVACLIGGPGPCEPTGSRVGVLVGLLAIGGGSLALMLALIAMGIRLGLAGRDYHHRR